MECKRRLADGDRQLAVMMLRALAGKWSASVGWKMWQALTGGNDDAGWRMECERRLADGERWLADGVQASAGGWQALAAGGNGDARVCWRMECKGWLADGERRLSAAMMQAFGVQASAGRW